MDCLNRSEELFCNLNSSNVNTLAEEEAFRREVSKYSGNENKVTRSGDPIERYKQAGCSQLAASRLHIQPVKTIFGRSIRD